MIVPGLPTGAASAGYTYNSNQNNVDVHADFGSPVGVVAVSVSVAPGVIIGSTSTSNPAMDCSGFASGSTITIINHGRIQGAGGAGGRGHDGSLIGMIATLERGGGGGGGAGSNPGAGGVATAPAVSGTAGTTEAGGGGGASSIEVFTLYTLGSIGAAGGIALTTGALATTIDNGDGEIWGGGGGGGGGVNDSLLPLIEPATAGGGPGQPGVAHSEWGSAAAGNAVSGSAVVFTSGGSSPQREGAVG